MTAKELIDEQAQYLLNADAYSAAYLHLLWNALGMSGSCEAQTVRAFQLADEETRDRITKACASAT